MSTAQSVQEQTFLTLREQIITMRLLPGTAMSVYEVSDWMNVSRTPVREAFIRLAAEALVEILPQRKTLVTRIDFSRVRQERFLRASLELAAAKQFFTRYDPAVVAKMRDLYVRHAEAIARADAVSGLALDDAFHGAVFEGAGQMLSWRAIDERNGHYRRARLLMVQNYGEAETVAEEHRMLVEAYENGDCAKAVALTQDHLVKITHREARMRQEFPDYFAP